MLNQPEDGLAVGLIFEDVWALSETCIFFVERGKHGPPAVHPEHIIKLSLVVARPPRAVDFLDGGCRGESDLIWSEPYHRPISFVKLVYISRPVGTKLMPYEDP